MINHGFSFQKYNYIHILSFFFLNASKPIFLHSWVSIHSTSNLLAYQYDDKEVMIAFHSDVMLLIIIINQCYSESPGYML